MLLTARWLFDGRTPEAFEGWGVEVEDGRIVAVGPVGEMGASGDVVDLGDATLLPGLIDVHTHLGFDASDDPVGHLRASDDATLLAQMERASQRALAAGVTTVRDLGDRNYLSLTLRDRFLSGEALGPRIVASGPPLTVPQGHCWFLGGEVEGIDGIRQAVRDRVAHGVDVIKIMATGGNLTPTLGAHESQFTEPEIRAAVEEAHAAGLPLAVHAHGPGGIADALAAGADCIEHCTFYTADGVESDPELLARLAASGTTLSMTAAILPGSASPFPAMRQRLAAITENHTALCRAGARIVCSSDGGVTPNKPHDVLPHGVTTYLPSIGMTNAEALTATTAVAAEVCGLAEVTGTLTPGKDADILAVAGNPLTDLTTLHTPLAIYTRGRRVTPRN